MLLGSLRYATNDIRIFAIDYSAWLAPGYVMAGVVATITPTSTVSAVLSPATFSPDKQTAYFKVTCGTVNESFTLDIVSTDTLGQVVNDTVNIAVVDPGAP